MAPTDKPVENHWFMWYVLLQFNLCLFHWRKMLFQTSFIRTGQVGAHDSLRLEQKSFPSSQNLWTVGNNSCAALSLCFRHSLCASLAHRQTRTYTIKHFMVFIHCSWQIWEQKRKGDMEIKPSPSVICQDSQNILESTDCCFKPLDISHEAWIQIWDEMIKYGLIIRKHTDRGWIWL